MGGGLGHCVRVLPAPLSTAFTHPPLVQVYDGVDGGAAVPLLDKARATSGGSGHHPEYRLYPRRFWLIGLIW